jgi:hypothetical protein
MPIVRSSFSTNRQLPKGSKVVTSAKLAAANRRLNVSMQSAVRDNQKKQQKSLEKAANTVLNA